MRTLGGLDRLIVLIPPLKTVAKIPPLTVGQLLVFINRLLLLLGFHKLNFLFPLLSSTRNSGHTGVATRTYFFHRHYDHLPLFS